MADPACGIQNRRDFLSASPRAGRQGGWTGGEPEPGAQLESLSWGDCSSPALLPGRAASLFPGAHSSPPPHPKGPWGDRFPAAWEAPQSGPLPGSPGWRFAPTSNWEHDQVVVHSQR